MAIRSRLLGLAGVTGVWLLAGAGVAQAAPPHCENITVDDLRQACMERAARCEPLKSAAERDECYRGRVLKTAETSPTNGATNGGTTNGPIRLTPNGGQSPAPAAPASPPPAASPAPASPPSKAPVVNPAPVPPPPPPPPPPQVQPQVPSQVAPPVVVRPGQPPAVTTPAPIPQPVPKADPAQNPSGSNPHIQRAPADAPKVVRPAPPPAAAAPAAPPPAPAVAAPRPAPGDGLETVRGFYEALAQADGARANNFLVPEKRNSGAYEVGSMSRYYGNMREPLRLLAAEPMAGDGVRVRYHYVYANGRVCDGSAEVSLSRRDGGRPLIERIRALNGC